MDYSVSFQNISKYFSGVQALKDVSLDIEKGAVHALVGENGAGKSTLIKILGGVFPPSEGNVKIYGKECSFSNAKEALNNRIRIVYQELQLIPQLTVAENLMLGNFSKKNGLIDNIKMETSVQEILDEYNIPIKSSDFVSSLSIGEMQLVEIAKCCIGKSDIIALDEPTSSLSQKEIDILFSIINRLREQGSTILYISHRFNEIFQICTQATVLRDGKKVKTFDKLEGVNSSELISCMMGREANTAVSYRPRANGNVCLKVENLLSQNLDSAISFNVKKQEILGFFGLVGSGRSELMRALVGADVKISGKVVYGDKELIIKKPKDAVNYGIAYLTEDRKKEGIIHETDIVDNIMINSRKAPFKFFIDRRYEEKVATKFVNKLKIKVSDITDKITQLSGGNQQKVILGRWLSNTNINILILDEPTRGIDVGAKQEIYNLIFELAEQGYSIVLLSSEISEIVSLCDRAYVLHQKKSITELNRNEINEVNLLQTAFFGNKGAS